MTDRQDDWDEIKNLRIQLDRMKAFALAHEEWEGGVLNDDSPWFDQMPTDLMDGFEEVQRLRNLAMGIASSQSGALPGPDPLVFSRKSR